MAAIVPDPPGDCNGRSGSVTLMAARKTRHDTLKEFALSLPGAWEDHPWGDTVVKVKKKIFVFLGDGEETGGMSVKLDESLDEALGMEGAEPTGYGLGRAGWVSVPFTGRYPSIGVLRDWIEESYRRIAPKTLIRELDERGEPTP
jgi:predicted DNA-binding protein (MmcQ/YjbR family)